jgi:hypothetical protein
MLPIEIWGNMRYVWGAVSEICKVEGQGICRRGSGYFTPKKKYPAGLDNAQRWKRMGGCSY